MPSIAFTVAPGGTTGWEVAACALALQLDRLGWTVHLTAGVQHLGLDPLDAHRLRQMLRAPLDKRTMRDRQLDVPDLILHALGNDLVMGGVDPFPPDIPRIGYVFAEQPITEIGRTNAERYALILAGSTWLQGQLAEAGIPSEVLIQGVDPVLFSPRARRPGPLTLFSGGKLEHRKAQDLVVEIHQRLLPEFPELRLLTAWYNPWPATAVGMEATARYATNRVEVGQLPHYAFPTVYAAADCAVFPNRCEGGTNLVAMECLAMGIPCVISSGHGHEDLPVPRYEVADMTGAIARVLRVASMQSNWMHGPYSPRIGPRTSHLDASWHWDAVGERLHTRLARLVRVRQIADGIGNAIFPGFRLLTDVGGDIHV